MFSRCFSKVIIGFIRTLVPGARRRPPARHDRVLDRRRVTPFNKLRQRARTLKACYDCDATAWLDVVLLDKDELS
jgi:hypothetical protein